MHPSTRTIVCIEFFQFTSFPIHEKEQHSHLPRSICLLLACQRGRGALEALPSELNCGMAWRHGTEEWIFSPISRCPRLGGVKEYPETERRASIREEKPGCKSVEC